MPQHYISQLKQEHHIHIITRTARMPRTSHIPVHRHTAESKLTPFLFARYSIPCERHPQRNEDSVVVDECGGLAAVFDGVGGSAAGQIASQTAARATYQEWRHVLQQVQKRRKVFSLIEHHDIDFICDSLQHLISEADTLVRTQGARRAGTDDLATTVALATAFHKPDTKGYTLVYAHVGDSRVYIQREQEPLKRLTNDDGLLAKLIENEVVNKEDAQRIDQAMYADQLTDTEFSYFRLRGGITQALGGPIPPTIHVNQITIYPGDRILLCTDGIHDNLTDKEIENILRNSPRISAARLLVEHSLQRSRQERSATVRAKPDDMSAVVMTCRF